MALTDGPVLFLVPARGGSRRVPGKNLRTVAGIPLVGRAVRAARLAARGLAGPPHRIVCSTDDPSIAAVARAWGAAIIDRPATLATDEARSVDVALHALDALAARGDPPFRALVLVQPTSPLTDPADLRAAVERFDAGAGAGAGRRGVVSVTDSHPAPFHVDETMTQVEGVGAGRVLTGAFYVVAPDALRRDGRFVVRGGTEPFAVAPERSIDVDEPIDLVVADALAAATPVPQVRLGDRTLGDGDVLVIAEAGVNHDGDPVLAHRLVDAAADAGADVVKFQTFDPDALAAANAPTADYQRAAGEHGDQLAMLRRLVLPRDAWPALQSHAADRGLVFLSTPFDDASADLLDGLGVPAFKVGSGELTNLPFLQRLAGRGRPLLVSTGMADMHEVAAAVDAVQGAGSGGLALFHCVSAYPAEPRDANLRAIATLRAAFAVPTGWSDHTPGIELPVAAVALGAAMIEKHLTLDAGMPGPDHRASLEPAPFAAMVRAVRAAASALGTGDKRPVEAERPIAAVARRSLHWAVSLDAGAVVREADLAAVRPGTGVSPARLEEVVGRRTRVAVRAGDALRAADVEGLA